MTDKNLENSKENPTSLENGLSDLLPGGTNTPQINKHDTMMMNNNYELVSQNRQMLSELYVNHGIIQALIDQPVSDGFAKGFEITSGQLDSENIELIKNKMELDGALEGVKQTIAWGRLFGGSGLAIISGQDPKSPLRISDLREDSPLEFYPADNWELNLIYYAKNPIEKAEGLKPETPYMFYGTPMHHSRVLKFKGKQAPSITRPRLRGWGMSEVERLVRSFNQYLKNNNVIFELLDEAKVDIFKVDKLNTSLLTSKGTAQVQNFAQIANMLKSHLNAILIDKNDEYDQKQMNFSGLSDMLKNIREGVAGDLRMPVTKLFGISSAGFNSGEDDIENYNLMIESEVRAKAKAILIEVIKIECQRYLGFIPDDIDIEWPSLRMLSATDEETVKTSKLARVHSSFSLGLIGPEKAKENINHADLLPVKIDEDDELFENPTAEGFEPNQTSSHNDGDTNEKGLIWYQGSWRTEGAINKLKGNA